MGLERLTADLMKTGRLEGADPTPVLEFTAYQVGVDIASEQLVALAEHIKSSTEMLTTLPAADNGAESAAIPGLPADNGGESAADTPNGDREAVAAVVASIHAQTNDIVELAKRLPTLSPKRDEGYTQLDPNDYIDEIADRTQHKSRSLVVKELNPIPNMLASATDVSLMVTNLMENAVVGDAGAGQ